MALTWKKSSFGTDYAFLGKIQVGAVSWKSARSKDSGGRSGHYFRSELFGSAPDVPERGTLWDSIGEAKKEAEDMAVAYADYIGRKVHGDEAWDRFVKGL